MNDITPRLVVARMVYWLQGQMNLNAVNCYSAAAPDYIEGQVPFVLQVCPGAVGKAEGGDGGQEGNVLFRRMFITITLWQTMLTDMPGRTEDALITVGRGILDQMEVIRRAFALTQLGNSLRQGDIGGLLYEPMRFEGESMTSWYDTDLGVLRRDITFSGKWGVVQPAAMSPVESDFAGMAVNQVY